jgi:hypothetical protein
VQPVLERKAGSEIRRETQGRDDFGGANGVSGGRLVAYHPFDTSRPRRTGPPGALRRIARRADSSCIRLSSLSRVGTGAAAAVTVVGLAFASGGYPPADHGLIILAFALVVLVASLVVDAVPRHLSLRLGALVLRILVDALRIVE